MRKILPHINKRQIVLLIVSTIVGLAYIIFTWKQVENEKFESLKITCESIAVSIPIDSLDKLKNNSSDLDQKYYRLIKNTLIDIIRVNKNARFAYIYIQRNNTIYFVADSEPESSKDYSPPGQEYTEATVYHKQPFIDGRTTVTIPLADRWGVWRSILVPLKDRSSRKTIAVFGMDFNSRSWNYLVFYEVLKSGILIILLLSFVFFLISIEVKNRSLRSEISQRKKIEKALQISDNKNYLLNNSSRDSIFSYDTQGRFTSVNKSLCVLLNREESQIIGHTHEELGFTENQCKEWNDLHLQVIETNSTVMSETFTLMPDGNSYFFEIVLYPLHNIAGKIVGIGGTTRDITERKKIEANLINSLALMEATLESTDNGVLVVDCHGTVVRSNNRFAEMWTIPSELLAQGADDKLLEHITYQLADPLAFIAKVKQLYDEPSEESFDLLEFKDGRVFERLSKPMFVNGEAQGRVWSFLDITQRKHSEELLFNERSLFRTVIDLIPDAIYVKNEEGRKILANPKEVELTGKITEGETIGKTDSSFYTNEIADNSKQEDRLVLELGESILNIESTLFDKNGIHHDLLGSKVPLLDINGKIVGIVGINRDITGQKQAEKEISMLANAMKSINEFVSITDMENKIIFVNESFLKTYGYTENELIGRNVTVVQSPNNPSNIGEQILSSTLSGKWEGELLNTKKDGTEFPIFLSTSVIHDTNGNPIALIGVSTDISDRKKAEELLRFSEERYRTLVDNVGEGIAYVDPNEVFLFANPVAEVIFGTSKGGLVGKSLKEFINEEQFESVRNQTQARQQGKRSSYEIEFTRNDGEIRNLLISAVPQFDNMGIFVGAYGVFRDITNRKEYERTIQQKNQELQALNVTKDKFFSIIAHDLKNPFNTLLGFTELLLENIRTYDIEQTEIIVDNLHSTTLQTHKLLENLLDWARSQQNRIDFNPTRIDLNNISSEIVSLLKPTANNKSITLDMEIEAPLFVLADSYMISAILRNLISNAIKFTKTNGFVKIHAKNNDSMVLISISDNGVGIRPENLTKLFKIDTNISQEGTSGERGTGLGLLLCKEFVEKHGGVIWVESEVGKGSTFFFTMKNGDLS